MQHRLAGENAFANLSGLLALTARPSLLGVALKSGAVLVAAV